jgi:hypothetical protein
VGKAFEEETERRIVAAAPRSSRCAKFSSRRVGVILYRIIDIAKVLREVVVGPGEHAQVCELGVRRLMLPPGLGTQIAITASAAWYRG